jgi:DNA helicase-2/ATP-dependent DNA helicase PcrA
VVDWKTGDPPATEEALQENAIQLAVYRLAWAETHGVPVGSVRAAFHYVRSGRTVTPPALPGAAELAALLDAA